ncbi:hypothetical protein Holit_01123 [Hollandina sp. SP2]
MVNYISTVKGLDVKAIKLMKNGFANYTNVHELTRGCSVREMRVIRGSKTRMVPLWRGEPSDRRFLPGVQLNWKQKHSTSGLLRREGSLP